MNNLQSRFIAAGQFTDVVDELLLKFVNAKVENSGRLYGMTGDNDNDKIRKDGMYIPSGGAFLLRFVELCKKSSLGTP